MLPTLQFYKDEVITHRSHWQYTQEWTQDEKQDKALCALEKQAP